MRKRHLLNNFNINLEHIGSYYDVFCFLNSNNSKKSNYYGIGIKEKFKFKKDFFVELKLFHQKHHDYIFGYFPYDLKNLIEPTLSSQNKDFIQMEDYLFFIPKIIIHVLGEKTELLYHNEDDLKDFLNTIEKPLKQNHKDQPIVLKPTISKKEYLKKVNQIKGHIRLGDIYEMNFCYEFNSNYDSINSYKKYKKLNEVTNAPYSVFLKNNKQYILSASPERFLKKEGEKIISQPIKGTARRGLTKKEDQLIKKKLEQDPKEKAENIMIVDLVRNDLSRTAARNSVKVEELCKVYTFDTVHQMISTISSKIRPDSDSFEVIKYAFPMGSMTGAPKIEAMKIIEEQESSKRGIYSGAIGYFTPEGDFDFNVVIRSLLINDELKKCSLMVGGAITLNSTPEKEYEETLTKAEAILKSLY